MKIISSISTMWQQTRIVIFRFPIQFLLTVFAICVWLAAIDNNQQANTLYTLLAISNIAFTFTLAFDLYAERAKLTGLKKWSSRLAIIALCMFLYFLLFPVWRSEEHTSQLQSLIPISYVV